MYLYLLVYCGAMSLVAFVAYLIDKIKARRDEWRISESMLLSLGFLGGSVGAILAMELFRHKTKHWYFRVVNIIGLIWQAALVIFLYVKGI